MLKESGAPNHPEALVAVLRLREGNDFSTLVVPRGRYDQMLNFEDPNNSAVRSKCFFLQAYVQAKQLGGKVRHQRQNTHNPRGRRGPMRDGSADDGADPHWFAACIAGAPAALQRLPSEQQGAPPTMGWIP